MTQKDVDRIALSISSMKKRQEVLRDEREKILEKLRVLKKSLENVDADMTLIDIVSLKSRKREMKVIEDSLISLRHMLERESDTLVTQEVSVKRLKDVPCGDQFPTCKFIKDSHDNRKKLQEQRLRCDEMRAKLIDVEESLSIIKRENIDDMLERWDLLEKKKLKIQIGMKGEESALEISEINECNLSENIERLEVEKRGLLERVVTETVSDELERLKGEMKDVQDEMFQVDSSRMSASNKIGRIDSALETLYLDKERFQHLKRKWKIYENLLQAMSKRGIPLQIIMSQLPVINSEISKILQGIVSFTVELEADPDSNAMDVFIDYGDSRRVVEVASGMEKMIASLAIRVALINVSSLPKTDMFVIDEGFGALDDLNIESCNRMLESLKKWFRSILIITHVDAIKDVVDNVIDVTWSGKDAQVVYR